MFDQSDAKPNCCINPRLVCLVLSERMTDVHTDQLIEVALDLFMYSRIAPPNVLKDSCNMHTNIPTFQHTNIPTGE